jgi:predicted Zn-dependent peptidase
MKTYEVSAISTPLSRFTLSNGLRVMVAPDDTTPLVAVSVHYDVGSRSEPEGRSGFAHLFEHMMFQGSESVPKGEHPRLVQTAGGFLNGTTNRDYTVYFDVVPREALETALFLEADRMRAPLLGEAELRNQVDVVKEEILNRRLGQPYGRFPVRLSSVLYDTFPNAHDGWGDFESLEKATLDECATFFDTYYSPSNAVLTITGAVTIGQAEELVLRYFDDVSPRHVPPRPNFDEPVPTAARRSDESDPRVPLLAVAAGYRMPDPSTQIDDYLAHLVLGDVLTAGHGGRLQQRLVHQEGLAIAVDATPLNGAFFARHPDTFSISAYAAPAVSTEQVLDVLDEELNRLVQHPPTTAEVTKSVMQWTTAVAAQCDDPAERAQGLGMFELLHGQAELLPRMPKRLAAVTPENVAESAKALRPDSRAVLTLSPSGGPA